VTQHATASPTDSAQAGSGREIGLISFSVSCGRYHALKAGHSVVVYEADKVPGGMAAHFDFGGLSLERFYHFVCKADRPMFELLEELGLGDRMRWVRTRMGVFTGGKLHQWGDPIALLKFPGLSLTEKARYGLMMFMATRRKTAGALEHLSAKTWIESWCGPRVYDAMWRPLFDLKFYEFADNISAAWLWTRIKRIGTSRKSLLEEELGYEWWKNRHCYVIVITVGL
jgi:protoporphyrinogen oxidase